VNDPTREELEEVAACGILLARTFLLGNYGDASVFADTLYALARDVFEGPVPDWVRAARPRIEAKLDEAKQAQKADGKASAS
jgi:hypothetical protein